MRCIAGLFSPCPASLLILLLLVCSCGRNCVDPCDHTEPGQPSWNGSFEWNGEPTLDGWEFGNPALASLANEAAPCGGEWSLKLTADWAPTLGFAIAPVCNAEDGDVIRLSAYVRAEAQDGGGLIALMVGTWPPLPKMSKSAWTAETEWTLLSLQDTVSLAEGDTVWVLLSSFPTEIVPRIGLFDVIAVEEVSR